jgi:hypothetical protein
LLDKQVILEETVSQLQNNNANPKAKIDLIDMRLEEQEQYSRRTSLRFHNFRVPTDQKVNISQPVYTDRIVLTIIFYHLLPRLLDDIYLYGGCLMAQLDLSCKLLRQYGLYRLAHGFQ